MQIPLILPILAAAIAAPILTTSGPYTDSTGQTWDQLPQVSDYASVDAFDARFATEIFTTVNGDKFQFDRAWTPSEEAYYSMLGILAKPQSNGNSGNGLRATVTCTHPVDEEYRAKFSSIPLLRTHVIDVVELADDALYANWGINFVPTRGYRWDSNDSADIGALLDEAYREGGNLNGQDMMIAFSADPTPGNAIGIGYVGAPKQLTTYYGSKTTQSAICQHEAGHNYTLNHCCDNNCIMQATLDTGALGGFHSYNENCSGQNHSSVMNNQKNRY